MYIQMVTALVLQLIQCVVHLPNDKDVFDEYDSKVGDHTQVYCSLYEHAFTDIFFKLHLHILFKLISLFHFFFFFF